MEKLSEWITKKRRIKCGINTQDALANAMGYKSAKQIRLWSTSERKPNAQKFSQLSKVLKIDEGILREDYKRVKKENELKQKLKLSKETKKQLLAAIEACHQNHVLTNISSGNVTSVSLQKLVIGSLENDGMTDISSALNQTLITDIKFSSIAQLKSIRIFVSEVAKAAVMIDAQLLDKGEKQKLFGNSPVWLVRLIIDSNLDITSAGHTFDFCKDIEIKNGDFDNESICHFPMSDKVVSDDKNMTLYDLVFSLNEHLRPLDNIGPPPSSDDEVDFKIYCHKLNADIASTNETELHKFCLINSTHAESLLPSFLALFSHLRIYEIENSSDKSKHALVNHYDLGDWLVRHLGAILEREKELQQSSNTKTYSESKDIVEKENDMATVNNNFNFTNNNQSTSNAEQNTTMTQNTSVEWHNFQQAFEELNKHVQNNIDDRNYRGLKNAVRDIQEGIDESGRLPKDSADWLEKSFTAISKVDSTWGLIQKTVKAIAVLNGAGFA